MADYDSSEAKALFKRLTGDRDRTGQQAAAMALRRAVEEVVEQGGGNFSADENPMSAGWLTIARGNVIVGALRFDIDGIYFREGEDDGKGRLLPLEYDGASQLFVGKVASGKTPLPGHYPELKSAVTVVIEAVIQQYRTMFPL